MSQEELIKAFREFTNSINKIDFTAISLLPSKIDSIQEKQDSVEKKVDNMNKLIKGEGLDPGIADRLRNVEDRQRKCPVEHPDFINLSHVVKKNTEKIQERIDKEKENRKLLYGMITAIGLLFIKELLKLLGVG